MVEIISCILVALRQFPQFHYGSFMHFLSVVRVVARCLSFGALDGNRQQVTRSGDSTKIGFKLYDGKWKVYNEMELFFYMIFFVA